MAEQNASEREICGKNFVITGAAMGIGAGLAEGFLKEGAKHVAIWDVSEEKGVELESRLKGAYGEHAAHFTLCDVTDERQLSAAYKATLQRLQRIDVVINNAGILDESRPVKMIQVNICGVVTSSYLALEAMRADCGGAGGTIINICSVASLLTLHVMPVYCATKSAALSFTNCLGLPERYERTKVRALAICYGATDSGILDEFHNRQYDEHLAGDTSPLLTLYPRQSVKSTVVSALEMFRRGESGSTWLSVNDEPVRDISNNIREGRSKFQQV